VLLGIGLLAFDPGSDGSFSGGIFNAAGFKAGGLVGDGD